MGGCVPTIRSAQGEPPALDLGVTVDLLRGAARCLSP
jgi:hypothetical protein